MKPILPHRLLATGLASAFALLASPLVGAETYTGRVTLTGEIQNGAKPGSISFVFKGQLTGQSSGDKANVSGGGLFRSTSDAIAPATFNGRLKTYTRLSTTMTSPGRLIKSSRNAQVTTSRRFVRFPGGSITLNRAINGSRTEKQRIRGTGNYRVRV